MTSSAFDRSAGNLCLFLRALAELGAIDPEAEPVGQVSETVARAFGDSVNQTVLAAEVYPVALTANGLSPKQLLDTKLHGFVANELRDGPFDKHGSGSRVLDKRGQVDFAEIDRVDAFAEDFRSGQTGETVRGLGADGIEKMLDANFERARATRRPIDRKLMDAEFPKLLELMGKESPDGLYLDLVELRTLIVDRQLPTRISDRLT